MTTENDVRGICLALPGVTERLSWGRPTWFARSLMARMWDDDVLTVKTSEREALASTEHVLARPVRSSGGADVHTSSEGLDMVGHDADVEPRSMVDGRSSDGCGRPPHQLAATVGR